MASDDVLTELLIAQLLEQDMRTLTDARTAAKLQTELTLTQSGRSSGPNPAKVTVPIEASLSDEEIALQLLAEEARISSDAAFAQSLQHSEDASTTAGKQYAQKLAAIEKKLMLDAEFARKLQAAVDSGDLDVDTEQDAESVLGPDVVESILGGDINDKGKGKSISSQKGTATQSSKAWGKSVDKIDTDEEGEVNTQYPLCGICMEPFHATHSPISASSSANSSSRLPFGLHLPCPQSHAYCIDCLSSYIRSKLDPEGDGNGTLNAVVFPIRCPECPLADWTEGIPDEVASRVLSEKVMAIWFHQKLLDSLPRTYCPNPRCSALVQLDEDPDEPEAVCPVCSVMVCVPCRTIWHEDLTCEEYQALPLDERSPEDQQALQLMKAQHWRRCPKCSFIIELTEGCYHITCRCSAQFCFKCGSLWDNVRGRCTRVPSCELFNYETILEEREQEREQARQPRIGGRVYALTPPNEVVDDTDVAPPPYRYVPPANGWPIHRPALDAGSFDWLHDRAVLCPRHWFTIGMVQTLTCGYCHVQLNSLADLQYHMRTVRRHNVYACCGRFFKEQKDFDRHCVATSYRFGGRHVHQIRREI
ncbi:hypothetical protein K474DRAFT_1720258 [Panus rudis PR-1116 ss-1]|nr:hypothetical protein K474DRAFT_1720258 [Panus rudis PR-1116 ss-1]